MFHFYYFRYLLRLISNTESRLSCKPMRRGRNDTPEEAINGTHRSGQRNRASVHRKPSSPRLFFVRVSDYRFSLVTGSGLSSFSVSSLFSLGGFLGIYPFLPSYSICWHVIIVHSHLLRSYVFLWYQLYPLSFLMCI